MLTGCEHKIEISINITPISNDLKEKIVRWYYEDGMTFRDIRDIAHSSIGLI
jgi:hypothetical protein